MGNPAGVKRKKKEKRRKKFEDRLGGPLAYVSKEVRDEIRAKRAPLGDILIRHNVLRRISPRWYFRFPGHTPVAQAFGETGGDVYGRVGTIYCNEEPAIDLLEVVMGDA